jgi:hypothetical protein
MHEDQNVLDIVQRELRWPAFPAAARARTLQRRFWWLRSGESLLGRAVGRAVSAQSRLVMRLPRGAGPSALGLQSGASGHKRYP